MSAADLVEQAVTRHGAVAFDGASELVADVACGGAAFAMRFKRGALTRFPADIPTQLVPTRRRVTPRRPDNKPLFGPTLVWIEIHGVELVQT